jgi:hypothetical protein
MVMKSLLCITLAVCAMATAANAASLAVSPDKLTYNIGETITLTVTGDDGGASTYGIFGRLDYSGALVDNGTRSQMTLTGNNGNWIKGTLSASDNGVNASSEVFNQIAPPFDADTATNLPGTLATVTLIAMNLGLVNVTWHTVLDGFHLSFFGLTDAPGTSFTIVPEPATAVLLGLGLLALATVRRGGTP